MAGQADGSVVIVGAGVFGASAALELRKRGHIVTLLDPGPVPHVLAASTDISKVLRMDYGADEFYMELMEAAFQGWDAWNEGWGEPLFHQTGMLLLAGGPMAPGGFEHDSYQLLRARGHHPERLSAAQIKERFPAWDPADHPEAYFNPRAGWAESGEVVARLIADGKKLGVKVYASAEMRTLIEQGKRVHGVRMADGREFEAEYVVLAAGAWSPALLPQLEDLMWSTGQPVFHFRVEDIESFQPPKFAVWSADIAGTGWYGFPALDDGTVKVANHGPGRRQAAAEPRQVDPGYEEMFRAFFRRSLPALAEAPMISNRLCMYCDTWDGDFWIDFDPDREGLLVAAGGSGHGFKFAPMLGPIIADVLERKPNRFAHRFRWRRRGELKTEDARYS
ncbi:MAG TPA: FAD-dependent oxidoreductase [Anaerolineales bacterium]|nr:FAD-dependent oxidoreductase [Anaerolineales bacterium]